MESLHIFPYILSPGYDLTVTPVKEFLLFPVQMMENVTWPTTIKLNIM